MRHFCYCSNVHHSTWDRTHRVAKVMEEHESQRKNSESKGERARALTLGALLLIGKSKTPGSLRLCQSLTCSKQCSSLPFCSAVAFLPFALYSLSTSAVSWSAWPGRSRPGIPSSLSSSNPSLTSPNHCNTLLSLSDDIERFLWWKPTELWHLSSRKEHLWMSGQATWVIQSSSNFWTEPLDTPGVFSDATWQRCVQPAVDTSFNTWDYGTRGSILEHLGFNHLPEDILRSISDNSRQMSNLASLVIYLNSWLFSFFQKEIQPSEILYCCCQDSDILDIC